MYTRCLDLNKMKVIEQHVLDDNAGKQLSEAAADV